MTYGHQGGKTAVRWGWWCAELGYWDWHIYTDVYKIDDWLKKKENEKKENKQTKKKTQRPPTPCPVFGLIVFHWLI